MASPYSGEPLSYLDLVKLQKHASPSIKYNFVVDDSWFPVQKRTLKFIWQELCL